MKELIEEHVHSSAHLSKKHVHPKLAKLFELGGLNTVFERAEGQYLYDMQGNRFLDFLGGGGVFLLGRNHPKVTEALRDVLDLDLPNLCVVNASILGGVLAEKLINLSNPDHFSKVLFANSGTEATDMTLRFARFVTGRRRFLYLEGAFHGRTYAAASVCGQKALKEGMEPMMPVCTPIKANDIGALRRELRAGDVAGFIFEPVQGMTLEVMDPGYLREAEILCRQYGTVMIADEVQSGLGRAGDWFVTCGMGVRPDLITSSKILSGGQVPVSAVLMSEEMYDRIYTKFKAGPIYFSTFAENNLSMAGAIATLEALKEIDAPARAMHLSKLLRDGVEKLRESYDVIEQVKGRGLMLGVFFKPSKGLLGMQHRLMDSAEPGSFGAAVNVDLYGKARVICQIPGPGLDAIKILPPVVSTEEDVAYFLSSLEDVLSSYYTDQGPIRSLSRGLVRETVKSVKDILPASIGNLLPLPGARSANGAEKKKPAEDLSAAPSSAPAPASRRSARNGPLHQFADYSGDIQDHADLVIVGSGPGGAMLAHSAAREGKSVIVIEAGPVLSPGQFGRDIGETLTRHFWDGGLRATRGNVVMPSLHGKVLGGGSVFNSAICLRMPEWQAERWKAEYGVERMSVAELEPEFDFVEDFLNVATTPLDVLGPRNELFLKGAAAMGFDAKPIDRNVSGCRGSGQCINGCNNGAKHSMDRRGIPEAIEHGARVYTSVFVDKLIMRGNRVAGVTGHVTDPETGKPSHAVRITGKAVVLAAGAFNTPTLMFRSGIRHPALGYNLRSHPGLVILGKFADPVDPWTGVTQGVHITKFLQEGIKLESVWTASSLMAATFKGHGAGYKDRIAEMGHMASWDAWTSGDDSIGRVRLLPGGRPDYQYDLGRGDAQRLVEGCAKLAEMAFAAGAKMVFTQFAEPHTILYGIEDVEAMRRSRFEPGTMSVASNHVFGTTRMGADSTQHVCDSFGKVYGIDDLYVCDTGVFPASPGVNPMATLWAFAHRMGRDLAARY
jgi:ornithine--oxo-acid transaminase